MESSRLWDDQSPANPSAKPIYLSVSGNTGAGKSTLIQAVVELAAARGISMVGVSERTFHHPLLRRMFADPAVYAFPIQLNFMLQRHLFLLRHLELGHVVLMERSHLDDEMFLREHVEADNISVEQRNAYLQLATVLHRNVPVPDVFLLLDVPPAVSMARIRQSEENGGRPREFPNDDVKLRWVHRWYQLYQNYHAELRHMHATDPTFARTMLIEKDAQSPSGELADELVALVEKLRFLR